MDDSKESAAWSVLLESPWESYENICVSCALQQLGVDATDFSDEVSSQDESQFLLNLMKGNIAQALVKTILQAFNYDVYPYGYENYLSTLYQSRLAHRYPTCQPEEYVLRLTYLYTIISQKTPFGRSKDYLN